MSSIVAMTSKYSIARTVIDQVQQLAAIHGLDAIDVQEATMILLIQTFKESRGSDTTRRLLQYEVDSLSSGVFEIQRGSGHS